MTAHDTGDVDPTRDNTLAADERSPPSSGSVVGPLARGDLVGRYVILGTLGAGGMGVVYGAYDPDLDRKVAIKLILGWPTERGEAAERLQREAKAMARLTHPNVVTVHDVGVHNRSVFIAMESVDGSTLTEWMASAVGANPHPWATVVDVFVAAGRGLAAAHDAGVLHRDFKPDNVMLASDGRVLVMDFGLARHEESADEETDSSEPGKRGGPAVLESRLTQTGALLGTPRYMSPEQFRGASADVRSEQFAFCVALYEGLYGERPFGGDSLVDLVTAVTNGEIRESPRGSAVPGRVRRVVLRGLAPRPDDRYGSMQELLAALAGDQAKRRRTWVAAGGAVLLVVAATVGVGTLSAQPKLCAGSTDRLIGIWDSARKQAVRDALVAAGPRIGESVWERVNGNLDAYTTRWAEARTEALSGDPSPWRAVGCADGQADDVL